MPAEAEQLDDTDQQNRKRRDEAALLLWQDYMGGPLDDRGKHTGSYAGLLTGKNWVFDPASQTYSSDTGTTLKGPALSNLSDAFGTAIEVEIERHTRDAIASGDDGDIDLLILWMAAILESQYTAQAALGAGGFANLTPAMNAILEGDTGTATKPGSGIAGINSGLRSFRSDLKKNWPPMPAEIAKASGVEQDQSDKQAINRAGMFAKAGHVVFVAARQQSHVAAVGEDGKKIFTEVKYFLEPSAHHCRNTETTDGCLEIAAAGWNAIGTYPLIGLRTCGVNDRCHALYR